MGDSSLSGVSGGTTQADDDSAIFLYPQLAIEAPSQTVGARASSGADLAPQAQTDPATPRTPEPGLEDSQATTQPASFSRNVKLVTKNLSANLLAAPAAASSDGLDAAPQPQVFFKLKRAPAMRSDDLLRAVAAANRQQNDSNPAVISSDGGSKRSKRPTVSA